MTDTYTPPLPSEFRSGNSVSVERATITRARMAEILAEAVEAYQRQQWRTIETAPQDGRELLLGYRNSHGHWRTLRGRWVNQDQIDNEWEGGDEYTAGWYEEPVEGEHCYPTSPTHWMPLPPAPETQS